MSFIQNPFVQQIVLGTAAGWTAGYCVKSVGRVGAGVSGSGILLWHIAEYKGVLPTEWKKQTQEQLHDKLTPTINNAREFAKRRRTLSVGFVGGFLLGMAT